MSTTRRRRPALIALVIIATCGCLALGWWQWTRFQSTSGTFQNLGYALQWPLFAWFCVYAYRNFVRYEETPPQPPTARRRRDTCRIAARAAEAGAAATRRSRTTGIQRLPSRASQGRWPGSRTGPPHDRTRNARGAARRACHRRREDSHRFARLPDHGVDDGPLAHRTVLRDRGPLRRQG
ncbi:hypothetical protein J113_09340 [Mycobacterium tuberculosis CAS/NITR204]|uniref:Lipoprotein LprD n=1 Tax=Mycobacterium tuberculosis CAS/NITR204 TaxID=1310114 RepID=R4M593_MYCTX|nr:hypothetical protein J113_09340 [Mycobacterium tuberculosis CAS/NITR204]